MYLSTSSRKAICEGTYTPSPRQQLRKTISFFAKCVIFCFSDFLPPCREREGGRREREGGKEEGEGGRGRGRGREGRGRGRGRGRGGGGQGQGQGREARREDESCLEAVRVQLVLLHAQPPV